MGGGLWEAFRCLSLDRRVQASMNTGDSRCAFPGPGVRRGPSLYTTAKRPHAPAGAPFLEDEPPPSLRLRLRIVFPTKRGKGTDASNGQLRRSEPARASVEVRGVGASVRSGVFNWRSGGRLPTRSVLMTCFSQWGSGSSLGVGHGCCGRKGVRAWPCLFVVSLV